MVKRIIPNVASTSAVIAAACVNEAYKVASRSVRDNDTLLQSFEVSLAASHYPESPLPHSCCPPLNNYVVFNDVDGVYTHAFEYERKADCLACSNKPTIVDIEPTSSLTILMDLLINRQAAESFCLD